MKYQINDEAVEIAKKNMEKAMAEMQAAKGKDLKPANERFLEASRVYLMMLTVKYKYNLSRRDSSS